MSKYLDTSGLTYFWEKIKTYVDNKISSVSAGVISFKGRSGAVTPASGDYTASMVGADPTGTADSAVSTHNTSTAAHSDIRTELAGKETAGAAAAVQTNLNSHTGDTTVHITAAERTAWNAKESGGAAAAVQSNLDSHAANTTLHITADERTAWNAKEAGGAAAAVQSNLDTHVADTTAHITADERTAWNAKQAAISGAASTITSSNLTANRALISNSSGKVSVSAVTSTELGYLDGVTSNVQTQLNGKEASGTASSTVSSHNTSATAHSDIRNAIPTNTSQLTNDSGFITIDDVPEGSTASTTAPKMDGTAATGSETAFARGDHVHPTDTSRASASALTTHTNNTTIHVTSSEHTQLGYLDGATSNIQTQIDTLSTTINSKPSMSTAVVYLSTDGWSSSTSGYYKTVSVSGVTTSSNLIVTPLADYRELWQKANICCGAQGTNTLTFYADKVPESTVAVNVLVLSSEVTSGNVSMSTATASLTSSGWASTTGGVYKAVTISGVTSSSNLVCSPNKDSRAMWGEVNLCAGAQSANKVTFYADTAPTSTVTVNVLILN